jgi:hypothetical protein
MTRTSSSLCIHLRYTTVSQPECVDGWLGVQLSDKLWFPGWNSKVMSDSAARIITFIVSQERATAALQSVVPAVFSSTYSFSSSQALLASPRDAATPAALPHNISAKNHAPPFTTPAESSPAAAHQAPIQKIVACSQARPDELQANKAVAASCAAVDGSLRDADPCIVAPAADAGRMYNVVEALLASQQALQDRHQASLQALQESLVSNQRLLLEALAASQRQVASAQQEIAVLTQAHTFALAAAFCLSVALLGSALVRHRF